MNVVDCIAAVREFHEKHGFAVGVSSPSPNLEPSYLQDIANDVEKLAAELDPTNGAPAVLEETRSHLILEETAESMTAMAQGDRVKLLDGLSDLLYVLAGTAVAFDLPLAEGFAEVHRSNMTKAVAQQGDPRLRDKGDNYEAPDLAKILRDHDRATALKEM